MERQCHKDLRTCDCLSNSHVSDKKCYFLDATQTAPILSIFHYFQRILNEFQGHDFKKFECSMRDIGSTIFDHCTGIFVP